MFELVKKIEVEQKFAEAVYRDFRSKRYGIASCCYIDLEKLKIKKQLCDWQDHSACETSCSASCTATPVVSVGLVGTTVYNAPAASCNTGHDTCPQVTVCPDNNVLENILKQLEIIQKEIINTKPDSFVFEQPEPQTTWHIVHNLDKYPNLNVEDTTGDDIVGQVSYINLNELEIVFIIPVAGTAYLS